MSETELPTTGMLFVRGLPTASTPLDGEWQYSLPCMAHYPNGQKTRITIVHKGEDARAFYCTHRDALRPGQPLKTCLHHPTVVNGEIYYRAQTIALAARHTPAANEEPLRA